MRITKKTLILISCASALLTIILLLSLFGYKESLSQYVDNKVANHIFISGFVMSAIGFLTDPKSIPLFVLMAMVAIFNVYEHETIHNISALAFFGYANYLMITQSPTTLGVVMLPLWVLIFFNILIFEVSAIVLIVSHILFKIRFKIT